MGIAVRVKVAVFFASVLVCSCGPSGPEPPAEVKVVLEEFMQAALSGDMGSAVYLVEPAWLEKQASLMGMTKEQYKDFWVQRYNGLIAEMGLVSYKLKNSKQISDTEWQIEVHQNVKHGQAVDSFGLIKVDDKWYIAGVNFD